MKQTSLHKNIRFFSGGISKNYFLFVIFILLISVIAMPTVGTTQGDKEKKSVSPPRLEDVKKLQKVKKPEEKKPVKDKKQGEEKKPDETKKTEAPKKAGPPAREFRHGEMSIDEIHELQMIRKRKRQFIRAMLKPPDQLLKGLIRKKWFKFSKDFSTTDREVVQINDEADLSSIKKSASKDIKSIIIFLGEIPTLARQNAVFAPVFLTDQDKIFGTRTDFAFRWVGYKLTMKFKQDNYPWKKTTLQETVIGSFVYASGTNLGFISGNLQEETRFYTNYVSEIITLRYNLPYSLSTAFSFDSRQYFFIARDIPGDFIMPLNHINVFPRIDLRFNKLSEQGIDQVTEGLEIKSWIGYGIRNRWEKWGRGPEYEKGEEARKFVIYSTTITAGILIKNKHNFIIRAKHKGGFNNDFLTRSRFGGTIDNAKLDVVHGFTLDTFRVNRFGLINAQYGYNILKRVRFRLFFDYAHVFSPRVEDVIGTGYGLRILAFGGLPVWLTHGIGRRLYREQHTIEQVVMLMTAAGW